MNERELPARTYVYGTLSDEQIANLSEGAIITSFPLKRLFLSLTESSYIGEVLPTNTIGGRNVRKNLEVLLDENFIEVEVGKVDRSAGTVGLVYRKSDVPNDIRAWWPWPGDRETETASHNERKEYIAITPKEILKGNPIERVHGHIEKGMTNAAKKLASVIREIFT